MTNQEKYADILKDIQNQYPDTPLGHLFGISKHNGQPVECSYLPCNDCLWRNKDCNDAIVEQWLAAPADITNEAKKEKQMTNREKYADILDKIQAQYPNESIETLFGLTCGTKQPVNCQDINCWECMWHGGEDCAEDAKEWLAAVVEDNNANKSEEKKQMKQLCAVKLDEETLYFQLSEEQIKLLTFLEDRGFNISVEILNVNTLEEL